MFGFGKRPTPAQPVEAAKPQGGATAFIADVNKAATDHVAALKARQDAQIARLKAAIQSVADEEATFVAAEGVPGDCVKFAALGCALGAAAAAMGDTFRAGRPDNNPVELMATIQSFVNVFVSRAQ